MVAVSFHDQASGTPKNQYRAMIFYVNMCSAYVTQHRSEVQMAVQQVEAGAVVNDEDVRYQDCISL